MRLDIKYWCGPHVHRFLCWRLWRELYLKATRLHATVSVKWLTWWDVLAAFFLYLWCVCVWSETLLGFIECSRWTEGCWSFWLISLHEGKYLSRIPHTCILCSRFDLSGKDYFCSFNMRENDMPGLGGPMDRYRDSWDWRQRFQVDLSSYWNGSLQWGGSCCKLVDVSWFQTDRILRSIPIQCIVIICQCHDRVSDLAI